MGGLLVASSHAAALAPSSTDLRAACDVDAPTVMLAPAAQPSAAPEARGVWTDARTLVWTAHDVPPGHRVRLAWSATARLLATAGQPLEGADDTAPLAVVGSGTAPERPAAWRWLPAGTTLQVAEGDRGRVVAGWRAGMRLVEEDAQGRVTASTGVQLGGALDDRYAAAEGVERMGLFLRDKDTAQFALWAPTARAVAVCVYPGPARPAQVAVPLARDDATGTWRGDVRRPPKGGAYTYLVDVVVPGLGLVRNRVTDPYSVSLSADSRRSWLGDLADPALAPAGWSAMRTPGRVKSSTDLAVYELHVRDFSVGDATVPAAHRGKYLAFTDVGSAGMRHLRGLARAGMTDVHLLPVFDFATVPEKGCVTPDANGPADGEAQQAAAMAHAADDCFNWGYDPLHYGAPEGSYATDAEDGAVRVLEFRRMVQALHAAGLRVGLDVVYNHTSAAGQDPKSVLDRIVPGYYQRLDAAGGVEHSTCCANTATERLMMGRLMIDTLVQWVQAYGIDSFRFDLMGHQPRALMERLQARLRASTGREIPLIGEGWNFGEIADGARFVQASQGALNGTGIGTFSDRGRDALRGGSATDQSHPVRDQGWLNGLFYDPNAEGRGATREQLMAAADMVRTGLAGTLRDYPLATWRGPVKPLSQLDYNGQPAGYASQPSEVVNYVENHDNPTLFDNDIYKLPLATSTADRARVQVLGAAVVAFSQGVAYFHAGLDTLRSKSLDRNSYDSGDAFNRLDWSYTDNGFGHGLPPKPDNGEQWPMMKPLLADASLKPSPADIAWTRDAFRNLLRIRASSTLFHLGTAEAVRTRLSFPNSGPAQEPTVAVGRLDGHGLEGARFGLVMYFINVDKQAHAIDLPDERGRHWVLHPVHRARGAADTRAAQEALVDDATGRFAIPARTAVVFVAP
jgi:pullulanase/glycogen debranching enzyme